MIETELRTTPIYDCYKDEPGVKLIDFGGWYLPVNFSSGIIAEHLEVRSNVGMFDVSHMGE
ncbi:MAG: glycine cleavage system aminomethyltransferase GcvT, partial [Sphaerochaetaceae bacterium]